MAFEFALPDLGEGVAEAEIENWLVSEGDEPRSTAHRTVSATAGSTKPTPVDPFMGTGELQISKPGSCTISKPERRSP